MANKISNVLEAIKTACETLTVSGDLRAVELSFLNAFTVMQRPILGLSIARFSRRGRIWRVEVLLQLVTSAGSAVYGQADLELAMKVDAALKTLVAAGTAGGAIDTPTWEPWASQPKSAAPWAMVGSVGGLVFTVEEPVLL